MANNFEDHKFEKKKYNFGPNFGTILGLRVLVKAYDR